jgi:AcrR family transcriptional regulator
VERSAPDAPPEHRGHAVRPAVVGCGPRSAPDRAGGRPRDPGIDDAVRRATRELLLEVSYAGLSLDAVARRAGVSRPALYRRWRSKLELVHDVLFQGVDVLPVPDTGCLADDIRACVRQTVAVYDRPEVQAALCGLTDELASSPLREELRRRLHDPVIAGFARMLERAVARGEASPVVDADVLMDVVVGTIVNRLTVNGGPVGPCADQLADLLLRALAPDGRVGTDPA